MRENEAFGALLAGRDDGFAWFFAGLKLLGAPEGRSLADWADVAEDNAARQEMMYGDERTLISERGRCPDIGLALSGGGIRSAAFSLGVLKGLYEVGQLGSVGYLSTVSGGGYAGGWYMVHGPDPLLFLPGSRHMQRLIQSGHYLTSANFSKSWTESAKAGFRHVLGLPSIWIFNWLVDVQANWPSYVRSRFKYALSSAFLYDHVEDRLAANWIPNVQKNIEDPLYLRLLSPLYEGFDVVRVGYAPVSALEATVWRWNRWQLFLTRMPGSLEGWQGMGSLVSAHGKPFWIVNAHVSLTEDDGIGTRNRSGDAFEITPLRAGCDTLGYVETVRVAEHDTTWQRIEDAMAISGAALDSDSLRQGFLASLALKTVGLDLGHWVDGWSYGWVEGDGFWTVALHNARYALESLAPVRWLWQLLGGGTTHDKDRSARSYLLTDGGHFDNTGMYALIRRGCRLIIVADATGEPELEDWDVSAQDRAKLFLSYREVESKLRTDFGVTLRMGWDQFNPIEGRQLVMDGEVVNLPVRDRPRARILYIRAGYSLGVSRETASFVDEEKARNRKFPNIPTDDQGYGEDLMNSMVELGYRAVLENRERFVEAFAQASMIP